MTIHFQPKLIISNDLIKPFHSPIRQIGHLIYLVINYVLVMMVNQQLESVLIKLRKILMMKYKVRKDLNIIIMVFVKTDY